MSDGAIQMLDPNSIPSTISFHTNGSGNEPLMKLTKDGMYYKGEYIEDAGKAYDAFMEVMSVMKNYYGG
jgi:hypothetical protein